MNKKCYFTQARLNVQVYFYLHTYEHYFLRNKELIFFRN